MIATILRVTSSTMYVIFENKPTGGGMIEHHGSIQTDTSAQ